MNMETITEVKEIDAEAENDILKLCIFGLQRRVEFLRRVARSRHNEVDKYKGMESDFQEIYALTAFAYPHLDLTNPDQYELWVIFKKIRNILEKNKK